MYIIYKRNFKNKRIFKNLFNFSSIDLNFSNKIKFSLKQNIYYILYFYNIIIYNYTVTEEQYLIK